MTLDSFKTEGSSHRGHRGPGVSVNQNSGIQSVSRDKAYLVGVIMGDASVYKTSDGRKLLKLQAADKEFVTRFARVFCNLTDLNWSGFKHEDTEVTCCEYAGRDDKHSDTYEVSKGIAPVYEHLSSYGEMHPCDILEEFEGYYPWLLRGLWDAEGSVCSESGRITFVNTDKSIRELYIALLDEVLTVDVDSDELYVKTDSQGNNTIVRIPARYSEEFLMKVNPTIERKRYRLENRTEQFEAEGGDH